MRTLNHAIQTIGTSDSKPVTAERPGLSRPLDRAWRSALQSLILALLLSLLHAGVASQFDHQSVSLRARKLRRLDMASMEPVEAATGKSTREPSRPRRSDSGTGRETTEAPAWHLQRGPYSGYLRGDVIQARTSRRALRLVS